MTAGRLPGRAGTLIVCRGGRFMIINWNMWKEGLSGKTFKFKNVAGLFQYNVDSALSKAATLFWLMQIPWLLYVLEPLWESRTAVLLQLVGVFMPLVIFADTVLIMIGFAVLQNQFCSVLFKERGEMLSLQNRIFLWIPVLRYWVLYRLLSGSARIPVLTMIAGAVMFWGIAILAGPLNPLPLLSLTVSIGAWLWGAKRLSNGEIKCSQYVFGGLLLGLFAVSLLAAYGVFYRTKVEIGKENSVLQAEKIPVSREGLKQLFYQGRVPNAEFRKLVDRYAVPSVNPGLSCLDSAGGYYKMSESERNELRAYLAGPESREDFRNLETLISSGESLKYALDVSNGALYELSLPHLNYYRSVMRYFSSRIMIALEDGKPAEAMRLFRLADTFQDTVLQGEFLIGTLIGFGCEKIRSEAIGAMLGSGLLSDADLRELLELNRNREEKIRSSALTGLRAEAYSIIDIMSSVNLRFIKLLLAVLDNSQGSWEDSLLNFLYRGKTDFPTPPCLWSDVIQKRYLLSVMRHQLALIRYFGNPDPRREALRDSVKRVLAIREVYVEKMILPDYFPVERRLHRELTNNRMTSLGIQIEQFRRKHGKLPETLEALGVELPVDAQSGGAIRYEKFKTWEWNDGNRRNSRELPGWMLSAPSHPGDGSNKNLRDCFKVITQWPVPPVDRKVPAG